VLNEKGDNPLLSLDKIARKRDGEKKLIEIIDFPDPKLFNEIRV